MLLLTLGLLAGLARVLVHAQAQTPRTPLV